MSLKTPNMGNPGLTAWEGGVVASKDVQLIAHLMRRAGFGATREELEDHVAKGYEVVVEELLDFSSPRMLDEDLIRRQHPNISGLLATGSGPYWLYRMISTSVPLQEKMSLFWHGIFATAYFKLTTGRVLSNQLRMFRNHGTGSLDTLLVELSKDPAMIIWLDNQDNHRGAINENYGRELLELFSMGVGNYTEQDIKECARAFTGWTLGNVEYSEVCARRNSLWPYGRLSWYFEYRPDDHDDGEKAFLGHRGRFNGEDIVHIICQQPATARFIARHMYTFFVADEPPVPQWPFVPPRDPEAIELLTSAYFDSNHDIRSMLRVLFNSDFFKSEEVWNARVKGPAELVAGVLRLTGEFREPRYEIAERVGNIGLMGQLLLNPPTVEGWTQGRGWIDTGTMIERINFAAERMGDFSQPGVKEVVQRIAAEGGSASPPALVDACLDEMGALLVSDKTRSKLIEHASADGDLPVGHGEPDEQTQRRVAEMVRLVASATEFQRA